MSCNDIMIKRRFVAKLLLLIFLMQSTQLGELGRIPLLVSHFAQHCKLFPGTTVSGFLKMHYIDETVIDADYAQDMELPFKTPVNYQHSIPITTVPETVALNLLPLIFLRPTLPPYKNKPYAILLQSIFQPPKLWLS